MIELVRQAAVVQQFMFDRAWRCCVIGGLAVIRWGEPRLTRDIDISLFTGFDNESEYVRALLEAFEPRVDAALEFAMRHRVVLLQHASGTGIDIALAGLPFEEQMIDRATDFEYLPGVALRTSSAEDLIVLKAFANRRRDWADIAGVVERQRSLDWSAILDRLTPLVEVKGEPEILHTLANLRSEGSSPPA